MSELRQNQSSSTVQRWISSIIPVEVTARVILNMKKRKTEDNMQQQRLQKQIEIYGGIEMQERNYVDGYES